LLLQQQLLQLLLIIINIGLISKENGGMVALGVGEHLLDLREAIYVVYFEDFWGATGGSAISDYYCT